MEAICLSQKTSGFVPMILLVKSKYDSFTGLYSITKAGLRVGILAEENKGKMKA